MEPGRSEKKADVLDPRANLNALMRIVILVGVILGGIWLVVRFTAGEKAANQTTAAILRRPIELKNSIENVPATSLKGFALSLVYTGTLDIDAKVLKGNDLDIYLVRPDQIEKVKSRQQFASIQGFEARKTKTYRRSQRLQAGDYYLVVVDTTLGILSAPSTDVQIHARLEP